MENVRSDHTIANGSADPSSYCGRVKLRYLCFQRIAGERIRKMIGKCMGGKKGDEGKRNRRRKKRRK